ncbi:uncharacterized protein TRUGW13939_09643 [Talaromyces rugulosus]|uniref:Uridylate kinase n=1 Tax=Talaromyces rugulosus TaxID=121627 RepID=A0A7H8R7W7_TALRU|nr:uncharacterized protein TRUGW13939_09643 [Talaromyces rugulosus]QKX62482.1 hypothetical protein TRUGW13939_09643 [Talaromyces rugulosus]
MPRLTVGLFPPKLFRPLLSRNVSSPSSTVQRGSSVPHHHHHARCVSRHRHYSSSSSSSSPSDKNTSSSSSPSPLKFAPFVAIVAIGTGSYILLVKSRSSGKPAPQGKFIKRMSTPRFSSDDVTVVFFLGGPGAGKGTQSANLVRDYGFNHLSAGDLLRAEQTREGSQYGEMIREYIREGKIVPMEVTVTLLSNAMAEILEQGTSKSTNPPRFLIDGFPRQLDQAHFFEASVCVSKLVLFLECPEEVLQARLLKRGETSGREDDNAASIKKRFTTFLQTSMPVVDEFEKQGKVISVSATGSIDEVYELIKEKLQEKGISPV